MLFGHNEAISETLFKFYVAGTDICFITKKKYIKRVCISKLQTYP